MGIRGPWYIVGLDNGGTTNNATLLDDAGRFGVPEMLESPCRVKEGPRAALLALQEAFDEVLRHTGTDRSSVIGVGLDTPGPASADGVISAKGATNFAHPDWAGFDFRAALEGQLGLPVVYSNDANAAALYAHHTHFAQFPDAGSGSEAMHRSSVSAIVGTGLGGGVVESGRVVRGASGMAGELGHIRIPLDGLLAEGQPLPHCNCGKAGDIESIASLTAIERNLLPYWLTRYPGHPLAALDAHLAAKQLRSYAERDDPLALAVFDQQAKAIGALFTIAADFTDPHAYFLGGGVVEASPHFRNRLLTQVRRHTLLRPEQAATATFAVVPDLDKAGARGAAIAAREVLRPGG
ncbi:ROK family protein [Streptomyces sp. S.PB5]|uniref:ROK family protein n=1 Tax=Streptomyces sp. S.PB5 TaxID=3020844 RepID=UPI0025AEDAFE|nr:ROK family protein [Streptomyces sp. S.PB5]MDN3027522.1 ROK family protein [Streptomyces sp. S.PB5]